MDGKIFCLCWRMSESLGNKRGLFYFNIVKAQSRNIFIDIVYTKIGFSIKYNKFGGFKQGNNLFVEFVVYAVE